MQWETNTFAAEVMNDISLKTVDSGLVTTGNNWKGDAVTPPYSRLYFILGGDPHIVVGRRIIPLKAGAAYIIPVGMSFKYGCATGMSQLYFHIKLTHVQGYDLLSHFTEPLEKEIPHEEMQVLTQLYKSRSMMDALALKQKVLAWVIDIIKSQNNPPVSHKIYSDCVGRAISYIQENLSLKLNIRLLAKTALTSESNLAKRFKTETGVPIGRYIDDLIIYEAEQLLLKSGLSIAQISEKLGFCDQFYFSRKFKSKFGVSPYPYRKRRLPT